MIEATDSRALWGVYSTHTRSSGPTRGPVPISPTTRTVLASIKGPATSGVIPSGPGSGGARGAIDFNAEVVAQWGTFGASGIRAWTIASDTGYRVRWRGQPRVGVRADITSGDRNRRDNMLGTFNRAVPERRVLRPHRTDGARESHRCAPVDRVHTRSSLGVSASWLFFWRTQQADGIYGIPGNLLRTAEGTRSRFVGHSPGVELEWRVGRHFSVTADAALFPSGAFLQEAPPARTIAYLATWTTFKF